MQIKKPTSESGRWVFLVWRFLLTTAPVVGTIGLVGLRLDLFFGERVTRFSGFHLEGRAHHEQDTRTP